MIANLRKLRLEIYRFPSLFALDRDRHFGPRILNSQIKSPFLTRKLLFWTLFVHANSQIKSPRITRADCTYTEQSLKRHEMSAMNRKFLNQLKTEKKQSQQNNLARSVWLEENKNKNSISKNFSSQESNSPTFCTQIFRTKVLRAAFLYLHFRFLLFGATQEYRIKSCS